MQSSYIECISLFLFERACIISYSLISHDYHVIIYLFIVITVASYSFKLYGVIITYLIPSV